MKQGLGGASESVVFLFGNLLKSPCSDLYSFFGARGESRMSQWWWASGHTILPVRPGTCARSQSKIAHRWSAPSQLPHSLVCPDSPLCSQGGDTWEPTGNSLCLLSVLSCLLVANGVFKPSSTLVSVYCFHISDCVLTHMCLAWRISRLSADTWPHKLSVFTLEGAKDALMKG